MGDCYKSRHLYECGRESGLTGKLVHQIFLKESMRAGRGLYDMRLLGSVAESAPANFAPAPKFSVVETEPVAATVREKVERRQKTFQDLDEIYVPEIDPTFVPWGEYKKVEQIIKAGVFYPLFIMGASGGGKTICVEQACAKVKREYVRVQISPESDTAALIGGFRLIDGETVFYEGPVVRAMKRGAILLLDEYDRGGPKAAFALQNVLEGKPILIQQIGEVVHPAPGFNIIATNNTRGRGSDDGRYSAAQVVDDANLERFVATIEQPYPHITIEKKIVENHMQKCGVSDDEFVAKLTAWADIIRTTFDQGAVDESISTRRLCHIVLSYSIFRDRRTAIEMCIARYDADTRQAFLDLYSKIDATVSLNKDELENTEEN